MEKPTEYDMDEYLALVGDGVGHCYACLKPTESTAGKVEPHTEGAVCPTCKTPTVLGLPRALHQGRITVREWDYRVDRSGLDD